MEIGGIKYPGLEYGYEYVLPSYDWAVRRLDSVSGKIQGMILLAVSVFAGLAGIGRLVDGTDLGSQWFILAASFFVVILVWGLYARGEGTIILPDPTFLYEKYSGDTEAEFKWKMLYWAGVNFDQNRALVERKWVHVRCMSVLLLLEVAALLTWLWQPGLI